MVDPRSDAAAVKAVSALNARNGGLVRIVVTDGAEHGIFRGNFGNPKAQDYLCPFVFFLKNNAIQFSLLLSFNLLLFGKSLLLGDELEPLGSFPPSETQLIAL